MNLCAVRHRAIPVPVLVAVAGLLSAAGLEGCSPARTAPARPPPALNADGAKAMDFTRDFLAAGPRPAGSLNSRNTAAWLAENCRRLGAVDVRTDEWSEGEGREAFTFRNVLATLPGTDPKRRILLASHYDSKQLAGVPGFNGANDSGSSTGLLLELIRVLSQRQPWPGPTLEFAFFDGEECRVAYGPTDGLRGSRRLAATLAREKTVRHYQAMILLDMVGDRDLCLTLPQNTTPDLSRRLLRLAEQQGVQEKVTFFANGNILDDHTPFQELGIPCVDLIDFSYGPDNAWWHTADDTVDKLSPASLEITGNLVLGLVRELSSAPAP